ncbi:MAG: hypothetical protein RBT75_18770, partial [Anaerolineae bacterium]|nr:hypothetical protein [Anaerolineae bacterium]
MPQLTRRRTLIAAMAILLVLIVGGLAIVLIARPTPDTPRPPGGTLYVSFADGALNHITLPAGAMEPIALSASEGRIRRVEQVVRARDGSRIAFIGYIERGARVYVAKPDGTDARPISAGPRDSQPAIAPDGSQVVF